MARVTEAPRRIEILQRIFRLGICKPVADQRGQYVGYGNPADIDRLERLLIERRARMFKS